MLFGDWQVNGITTLMSGTPFTVYDSQDVDLQGGAPEISGSPATGRTLSEIPTPGRGRLRNGST